MQKCPKCAMMYADEAKICRTCGAILEACTNSEAARVKVSEPEAELVTLADVAEEPPREENPPAWNCPQCKKSVPGNFDVCWNCFTGRDGKFDSEFAEIAPADRTVNWEADPALADIEAADGMENRSQADESAKNISRKTPDHSCLRCGSDKMVRNARVLDWRDNYTSDLKLVVYGDPEALIFKDRLYGTLTANICGQCGHVELHVENHAELYEHYRKSRG
jgi:hypothetical protein